MEEVRLGIIGIGNMGSAHAICVFENKIKGLKLTAICDSDPDRLLWAREQFGKEVQLYKDYRQLLDSGSIDAVLIAVPHPLHPIMAIEGFQRGLHVLTEKPAGIDTLHVRQMNRAAEEAGSVFGIMYNQRTNTLYAKLRELVRDGSLGELKRLVWIITNWYRSQAYYDSGSWRATWDGEGGGVLMNQCPHNLDLWQWIAGMPIRVRGFCHYGKYHNIDVEDDVTAYAEYANGATAVFIASTGEYPGTNRLEISGTKGKAVIENGVLKVYELPEDEREICYQTKEGFPSIELKEHVYQQEGKDTAHAGILQNFTNAILFGEPLLAPGIEGVNGLSISNAIYLSDWTKEWVELPMDEERYLNMLSFKQQEAKHQTKKPSMQERKREYEDRWSVRW